MCQFSEHAAKAVADAVMGRLAFLRESERPDSGAVRAVVLQAWDLDGGSPDVRPTEVGRDVIMSIVRREDRAGIGEGAERLLLAASTPGVLYEHPVAAEVARWLSAELWPEGLCIEYRGQEPVVVPIISYPLGVRWSLSERSQNGFRIDMNTRFENVDADAGRFTAVMTPAGFAARKTQSGETEFVSDHGPLVLSENVFRSMAAQAPGPVFAGPMIQDEVTTKQLDESHDRLTDFMARTRVSPLKLRRVGVLVADITGSTEMLFSVAPGRAARVFAAFLSEATAIASERHGVLYQAAGDGASFIFPAETDEANTVDWMIGAATLIQHVCGDTLEKHLRAEGLPTVRCKCSLEIGDAASLSIADCHAAEFGDPFYLAVILNKRAQPGEILLGPTAVRCAPPHIEARSRWEEQRQCCSYWYPLCTRQ